METSIERLAGCQVKITLAFDETEMKAAFDKAYKALSKEVALPGFRRGKAPRTLLERALGPEVAQQQVVSELIPESLSKVIEENELHTVGDPDLDVELPKPNEAYTVSATVPVMPVPEIGEWRDARIVKPKVSFDDASIDEVIEKLRERTAASVDITDRPVESGDFVYVRYQIECEDETLYSEDALPQMYMEVGAEWYTPSIDADVIGMSVGETKEIAVEYPDDYDNPRLAGKSAKFTATVEGIRRRVIPELDAEFFEKVGVADLDGLRARIREDRQNEIDSLVEGTTREQAMACVVRATKLEYPETLVKAETDERLAELEESLDREGLTVEDHLRREGIDEVQLRRRVRADSKRALAVMLVADALAKEHSIELPDEELEESVWSLAQSAKMGFSEMWETLERTGQLDEMRRRMLRTRVCDFVLEHIGVDEPEMTYDELLKGEWLPDVPDEQEDDEPAEDAGEDAEDASAENAETETETETDTSDDESSAREAEDQADEPTSDATEPEATDDAAEAGDKEDA